MGPLLYEGRRKLAKTWRDTSDEIVRVLDS